MLSSPDLMGWERGTWALRGTVTAMLRINEAGQVVGNSIRLDGPRHAFITGPDGMGMRDLGTLGGMVESFAHGINDAGQVVG